MIAPFGDAALEVAVDDATSARGVARALERLEVVLECVVGWDRVLVHLRDGEDPRAHLEAIARALEGIDRLELATAGRSHVVHAIYDGPDLAEVADASGLSPLEVARRHAASTYVVEVVGFLPGFAYLGGLDPSIARPRRSTPRSRVMPLSIGIAGARTAIYPLASPGGWNLIGRAIDVSLFDPTRSPAALFAVGDRVRFEVEDVRC